MAQSQLILQTREKLLSQQKKMKILVGLDGFVDEIIHVVASRQDKHHYERIATISDFSQRTAAAAGLSANIEFVPVQIKLGGNGPIMGNALSEQEYLITYIGALGKEGIFPVFEKFVARCSRVISIADPGHTDALEFNDGKLMLVKEHCLLDVSWDGLINKIGRDELKAMVADIPLLALTNWTELSEMNSLLRGFSGLLAETGHRPGVFIDLTDPSKRSDVDILEVLDIIMAMQSHAKVILGLNENESTIVSRLLGISETNHTRRAQIIREKLGLDLVVIHPLNGACYASGQGSDWVDGPYTKSPKLTTGAGDNFNAGFCNGWLSGLSHQECLAIGVCTSGFYVRQGHSPSRIQLGDFMKHWASLDCGLI